MNIQEAIAVFDAAEAESLAVVEAGGEQRPIGIFLQRIVEVEDPTPDDLYRIDRREFDLKWMLREKDVSDAMF